MPGLGLNIGLSVVKRESQKKADVEKKLMADGWKMTDKMGDRVSYFEKSGINITVTKGPMGTIITPSGPLRGSIFGEDVRLVSKSSTVGLGSPSSENKNPTRNNQSIKTGSDSHI